MPLIVYSLIRSLGSRTGVGSGEGTLRTWLVSQAAITQAHFKLTELDVAGGFPDCILANAFPFVRSPQSLKLHSNKSYSNVVITTLRYTRKPVVL